MDFRNKNTRNRPIRIVRLNNGLFALAGTLRKPSKERQAEALSQLVLMMGIFQVVATAPQVIQLWTSQDSSGLSFVSWSYYFIFSIVLVMYGVVQKQRPLVISYSINSITYFLVVLGIILF